MKLIGSSTSPFVRKARIALAEKRIEYEFVLINPFDPAAQLTDWNPLGKVPVLLTDDGASIYDSSVIVEYLDTVSPVGKLISEPGRQRVHVKRWEALADGLLDAATAVVLEHRRPAKQQSAEWIERYHQKVEAALRVAAHDLGERVWCAGDSYSLADIALGCALGYLDFRFASHPWRPGHPRLTAWYEPFAQNKGLEETAPG